MEHLKNVGLAFDPRVIVIGLNKILPLRNSEIDPEQNRIYQRIVASIRTVGLIEPLVVYPARGKDHQYTLLDGHLRYTALQQLGVTEASCLIATEDEAYTYNHKVNRLPPIQEHFMIMRAIDHGVSEQRIAETLNVDVGAIRRARDLLNGICAEAVELLKDKPPAAGAMREFRKVKPLRQIEMAEVMIASNTYSASYAQCLFAATPQDQLIEPEKPKEVRGLRAEDMARMEKEMNSLSEDFRLVEETHGRNVLDLVIACGYLRKLLDCAAITKFLSQRHSEILIEFKKISQSTALDGSA